MKKIALALMCAALIGGSTASAVAQYAQQAPFALPSNGIQPQSVDDYARAARHGQQADAIAPENARRAAGYRALRKICGDLASYGPECITMLYGRRTPRY